MNIELTFPDSVKDVNITAVYKSKNPLDTANHRSASILLLLVVLEKNIAPNMHFLDC